MDFIDAITAHIRWRVRIARFVDGVADHRLDSATAAVDDRCDLGQWIHGASARFERLAGYRELVEAHAHFHATAAIVAQRVERGDKAGAQIVMRGPFAVASKQTIAAILNLKNAADRVKPPAAMAPPACGAYAFRRIDAPPRMK